MIKNTLRSIYHGKSYITEKELQDAKLPEVVIDQLLGTGAFSTEEMSLASNASVKQGAKIAYPHLKDTIKTRNNALKLISASYADEVETLFKHAKQKKEDKQTIETLLGWLARKEHLTELGKKLDLLPTRILHPLVQTILVPEHIETAQTVAQLIPSQIPFMFVYLVEKWMRDPKYKKEWEQIHSLAFAERNQYNPIVEKSGVLGGWHPMTRPFYTVSKHYPQKLDLDRVLMYPKAFRGNPYEPLLRMLLSLQPIDDYTTFLEALYRQGFSNAYRFWGLATLLSSEFGHAVYLFPPLHLQQEKQDILVK